MSEYIHTAIIVTGPNYDGRVDLAQMHAESLGLKVTELAVGRNSFDSFMVAPSGAGSMHISVDEFAILRTAFVLYLRDRTDLDWVEVRFGREGGPAKVMNDCGDAQSRAMASWMKSPKNKV